MYRHSINGQVAEIHLTSLKKFYALNEDLFDVAVDAVIKGCVTQYNFDYKAHKFIGTVISLDGNEIYEVEITVTDKLEIGTASCNCPERGICYHIGALALNTGYETPIFSYHHTRDNKSEGGDSDASECAPQPLQEVYVKCEPLHQLESEPLNISSCVENKPLNTLKKHSEIVLEKNTSSSRHILSSNNPKLETSNCICLICDKMYQDSQQLEIHRRKIHSVAPVVIPMFQCAICSSRKNNKRELETHMTVEHADNECNICRVFFVTFASKQQHISNVHDAPQNQFQCNKCVRTFTTEKAFESHKLQHFEKYKCDACAQFFSSNEELKTHKNQSTLCTYKCNVCKKIFHRSENYNRHISTMHKLKQTKRPVESKYQCFKCPQHFSRIELYRKHLKTHCITFSCSQCEKAFPTRKALLSHRSQYACQRMRWHQCKLCNAIYQRSYNLNRHYAVAHTFVPVKMLPDVSETKPLIKSETETVPTI